MATTQWTLEKIRAKVRAVTGRPDISMLSVADLDERINQYYQNVMPKELKIFWGYTFYEFFCLPNIDQYAAPDNFQTLNPQVWADGFPIEWYESPALFYEDWPDRLNKETVATGDGVTNSFNFSISAFPVLPWSVYVTDGTQVAQDNGVGGFITPASGTIDYATGVVSGLSFGTVPAANTVITCSSETYLPNRPRAILFYKGMPLSSATEAVRNAANMFVLRPVPDDVYKIKMQGIQIPPTLTDPTDVPYRQDLGPLIAYGTSLEIFADFNQNDQLEQTLPQYNRYKDISMQDTYEEYMSQRATPRF